ncbi:hypothetical protein [Lactococcus cremoris]|uniref:hypothetical protein n=1 Tax=Lactococcus lactis subsp. cremoris TaxID=1359 RepID=UPI0021AAD769|nr:hypothetical protein [Lactococcus cremoris]
MPQPLAQTLVQQQRQLLPQATIAKTKTAAGDYGGPKTGNGVGKGPTVDRSDMSSAQLAQVQKAEANGAPQQTGGLSTNTLVAK